MKILLVDHRDSFVFNLAEVLRQEGCQVRVIRSTVGRARVLRRVGELDPDALVLSPGPGTPEQAGVFLPLLRALPPRLPVLGVCLGMQALAVAAGGTVRRAPRLVHGRATPVHHDSDPLFAGLASPFPAGRYHSLCVTRVPDAYRVVATAGEGAGVVPMAMRHRSLPRIGLQFHPESILTPDGPALVHNVLEEFALGARGDRKALP